jgi:type IV secretion system protein TrbI
MLEHTADPSGILEPPPKGPEEEYYVPKESAETLSGIGKAPKVKRFNRKMLAVIGLVGGGIVILAFAIGLQPPKAKPPEAATAISKAPVPNEAVNALPGGYDAVVPELGDPRPGDAAVLSAGGVGEVNPNSSSRQLTPLEQYAQQAELERLRSEDRARTATVSFASASGSDLSAGAQSFPGVADASQALQERLLNLAERSTAAPGGASSTATASSHQEDANLQDDKREFADHARDTDFALHATVERSRSPYTLFAGTILPCVLTQGINSDLPGQIGCMISQNVYDTVTGRHLLIPQGTKAIGTYDSRVAYGQERVLVVWTRLLRPDGSTLSLEGMPGTDLSGYSGLTGHVNNHYLRLLSGVVLGSLIGASAQIATGANSQNPSFAALAVQGAGQNINEAGQQITRKNLNIQPTIEVRPGARLNIFATKDLVLPPWSE